MRENKLFYISISISFSVLTMIFMATPVVYGTDNPCAIDLNNQEQVIQRLAELRLKVEQTSVTKNDLEFHMKSHYLPQVKLFAERFGMDAIEIENRVRENYKKILSSQQKQITDSDKQELVEEMTVHAKKEARKQILLKKIRQDGFEDLETMNKVGDVPLTHYVIKNDRETVLELLDFILDIDKKDQYGNTALGRAFTQENVQMIELLLDQGANINVRGRDGETRLLVSISQAQLGQVKLLLERNADVHLQDKFGTSALHYAAAQENIIFLNLIIPYYKSMDVRDASGATPLINTTMHGFIDNVELLLKHGANVHLMDNQGFTAMARAKQRGFKKIMELLKSYGALE